MGDELIDIRIVLSYISHTGLESRHDVNTKLVYSEYSGG